MKPGQLVDLYIFRKANEASPEERWKWDWKIWDPLIKQIYQGKARVQDLSCPICNQKTLYDYYLVSHLKRNPENKDEPIYVGDCFIGCQSCEIQKRAYGEAPRWVKENDVTWVSESARQHAEDNCLVKND